MILPLTFSLLCDIGLFGAKRIPGGQISTHPQISQLADSLKYQAVDASIIAAKPHNIRIELRVCNVQT